MRMSTTEQSTEQFNIGMPPDVWGPIFWDAMHIVSLAYPVKPTDADKAGARAFFESLASVIPCPICREHYSAKLKESPIALDSKGELIYWVWDIHNQVNTMLNKPTITIEQFMERMRNLGSIRGTKAAMNPLHIGLGLVVGIAVGAGALWAYQNYAKSD
jgi:hypothetical protein